MTRTIILTLLAVLLAACSPSGNGGGAERRLADSVAVTLPTRESDVYDQGRTQACWLYAMCACIEHEACRGGDDVVVSRQWLMSRLMEEQAMERYDIMLTERRAPQDGGRGTLSMRGVGPDALRLIDTYGMVPYQHERSRIGNSRVLERRLVLAVDNAVSHRQSPAAISERIRQLLPRFTIARHDGKGDDASFYYLSMRYTPRQFAESVMYFQRWHWYATDVRRPWREPFALTVSDNRRYHQYDNRPMGELLTMVCRSLSEGHAVYWEYGLRASPQKGGGGAASDHAMAIIGMRGDKFVCLNSYGLDWGTEGCCLVSKEYFLRHTCNIGIIETI